MYKLTLLWMTAVVLFTVNSTLAQKDFPDKIMKCIRSNDASCVQEQLGKKVSVSSVNTSGATLLHESCRYRQCTAVVSMLINSGSDVNAMDKYGYTPLHIAALNGCYDTIKLLIEKGADKSVKDKSGYTPYDRAVWVKQTGVYDILKP